MRNYDIININTRDEAKEAYNNSNFWKNYASRMQKSPFIKQYLYMCYDKTCQFCGRKLKDNFVVHHINYMNQCKTDAIIQISHPTEKRPNKTLKVPDCEKCYSETPKNFQQCIQNIRPVCSICNMIINKIKNKNADKETN